MKLSHISSLSALLLVSIALVGCGDDASGETSTSSDSTSAGEGGSAPASTGAGDGGSAAGNGGSGAGDAGNGGSGAGDAGNGGSGAGDAGNGGAGGEALTGDLWVDADGEVIGRYRATFDEYNDAIEGLVTLDDEVVFAVSESHEGLYRIEPGLAFYASDDCSGEPYMVRDSFYFDDPFRTDVVCSAWEGFDEETLFAVPQGYEPVAFEPQSVFSLGNGCVTPSLFGDPPTVGYPLGEIIAVTEPAFAPPLTIETR
jgi:hypothetical protein